MGKKLTIHQAQEFAKRNNGKCLSKKYINIHSKLKWQCKEGHIWEASFYSIKQGTWCPACPRSSKPKKLINFIKIAKKRGGKCLSTEYINNYSFLKFKCHKGHIWRTKAYNILRNSWCPICFKSKKLNIEEMQELAQAKGGKCLSKKYINSYTKLKWECKEKHVWEAMPYKIKQGTWCPECAKRIKIKNLIKPVKKL